jgi:hypothetical protein
MLLVAFKLLPSLFCTVTITVPLNLAVTKPVWVMQVLVVLLMLQITCLFNALKGAMAKVKILYPHLNNNLLYL